MAWKAPCLWQRPCLIAAAEVDLCAAALAVEGAKGEAEGFGVGGGVDGEGVGGVPGDFEAVEAGSGERGEEGLRGGVAGGCVGTRWGEGALKGDGIGVG